MGGSLGFVLADAMGDFMILDLIQVDCKCCA
jgi:hypothetical protein